MEYLISVIDDGQAEAAGADASATEAEAAAIDEFNQRLQDDGQWVFAAGLGGPASSTVLDNRGDELMISDGPFVESKEFLAGFWIVKASDLDSAMRLAADGSKACNRKVEVRPILQP